MNMLPVEALLKRRLVPGVLATVREVDNMADIIELLRGNKPGAFPMFEREIAGEDRGLHGFTQQRVTYQFTVGIGLAGAGLAGNSKGSALEGVRDQVKLALIGEQLEGMVMPIKYRGARTVLKDWEKALLIIGLDFSTDYTFRKDHTHA